MMMNQNFSDYSIDDSAGIQLSPDIQNYIAPNVEGPVQIEFDGYGTLHVLKRSEEGKLLSDNYLKKTDDEIATPEHEFTNMDKLEKIERSNMHLRRALQVQKYFIIIFFILFILFCILLKITLQGNM